MALKQRYVRRTVVIIVALVFMSLPFGIAEGQGPTPQAEAGMQAIKRVLGLDATISGAGTDQERVSFEMPDWDKPPPGREGLKISLIFFKSPQEASKLLNDAAAAYTQSGGPRDSFEVGAGITATATLNSPYYGLNSAQNVSLLVGGKYYVRQGALALFACSNVYGEIWREATGSNAYTSAKDVAQEEEWTKIGTESLAKVKQMAQALAQALLPPNACVARLPIIFLPGVAGTILSSGSSEVWPFAPVGNRADLAFEPDGKTPAGQTNIVVGDILRRLKTNFYGDFMQSLVKIGYTEGTDLYPFPYDWRYSNDEQFARLDQIIQTALSKTGVQKVILTAHSMGGVIARAYVYSTPERAAKVDSFITMGTPYWGATKVYYGIVNGYQFGNPSVRQELMKVLMQNYPAAYQLLPQVPFIHDTVSNQMLSLDEANTIRYKWFTEVKGGLTDLYIPTSDNVQMFNPALLQTAKQFYAAVGTRDRPAPLPAGVKQYVIIGTGVSTLGGYELDDWQPGILPVWPFSGSYFELGNGRKMVLHPKAADGDGTVPLWSLETRTATATYYVPYKSGFISDESTAHGDLAANTTVQSIVAQIIKKPAPDPNQYAKPQYWMDQPVTPGKVLEDVTEFELHSDAHLRVTHAGGLALGFNSEGGIDESLPGTFLSMDGVEYASISDMSETYSVQVSGISTGKFTLNVRVTKGGKATNFVYPEVPVKQGTQAQVTFNPSTVTTSLPPLAVNTDGKSSNVTAQTQVASSGQQPPSGNPGSGPQPASSVTPSVATPLVVGGVGLICFALVGLLGLAVVGRRPARKHPGDRPR